jgi:hypothetical protein
MRPLKHLLLAEGSFTWIDGATVIFTPAEAYEPTSQIDVNLDTMIKATNGLSLLEPVSLVYEAVGYLNLAQRLPEPDAEAIDPTSAIVAAFNRPVVPLGGDPASLPAAFSLSPEVTGRGEWLNTSTYILSGTALAGGVEYTVRILPDLVAWMAVRWKRSKPGHLPPRSPPDGFRTHR